MGSSSGRTVEQKSVGGAFIYHHLKLTEHVLIVRQLATTQRKIGSIILIKPLSTALSSAAD